MLLKSISLSIFILGVFCITKNPKSKVPQVDINPGTLIGFYNYSSKGRTYSAFEGIPYAKPPVGERRFKEPEPIETWIGVWKANFLTDCAHRRFDINKTRGKEDCLYLNVYVPRTAPSSEDKLDVIVYFHAGAFMYLSGHNYTQPHFLMDEDVVFVSLNYRLGVLGFLSTEDDVVPGNNGLKDQVMALRWVQDNIGYFGGNKSSVTIMGLEAGGASVHLHYMSKLSEGLFHKGFSQSGSALNPFAIQENALMKTKKLAAGVGCPTDDTTFLLVECLRRRSVNRIMDKVPSLFGFRFMPLVTFGPVIEKGGSQPFLDAHPYELLKQGKVNNSPWLASTVTHQGLFVVKHFQDDDLRYINDQWDTLAPNLLDYNHTVADSEERKKIADKIRTHYMDHHPIHKSYLLEFVKIFSDRYFMYDIETALRMQAKVSKVYFYMFGYTTSSANKTVPHGVDTEYFFGNLGNNHDRIEMKNRLVDMLVIFAKTGTPSINLYMWKHVDHDGINGVNYFNLSSLASTGKQFETLGHLSDTSFWKSLPILENEKLCVEREMYCHIC